MSDEWQGVTKDDERFWAKVDVVPGCCWVWQGFTMKTGYGQVGVGGKVLYAHRHVWELLVGEIPDGMWLDHLCRNRACVNPDHLEPVTPTENNHRGYGWSGRNIRKITCKHGHNDWRRSPHGWRVCRTCERLSARAAYYRRRARRS